jgi:hypothetical protein
MYPAFGLSDQDDTNRDIFALFVSPGIRHERCRSREWRQKHEAWDRIGSASILRFSWKSFEG